MVSKMNMKIPALSLKNIHKSFGGIVAIENFDLDVERGEVVALVGDNGAGKSTLVKIIAGMYQPTSGEIRLGGELVHFTDASQSRAKGIQVVYQDLALAESQPIYMNLFLGRERTKGPFGKLERAGMIAETEKLVRELDVRIPSAKSIIRDLSGGQRQGVAIARATHWATNLVLMDEPTAALGVTETAKVEDIIAGLKARKLAILIVSHSLDQVFRLSDRICVLRRGKQIGVRETKSTDKNEIVSMITGLSRSGDG
jgi:simple sugar transport system ATP-binding protein